MAEHKAATGKASERDAEPPKKADGAWLSLCEMSIKPAFPDAFNCLFPKG